MIDYRYNHPLSPRDVARVFEASGITRPFKDLSRLARMFAASDITISAWDGDKLVGVCRALTDYSYCCYLSDLAVDKAHQTGGIGKRMIDELRACLSEEVSVVLISAPGAMTYYPTVGFTNVDTAFVIKRAR